MDRVWPRGVSRQKAGIDEWMKEVAPSDELRRWFGHDPHRWDEFRRRYRDELEFRIDEVVRLLDLARGSRVTLVYGAKDTEHNNAVVLREFLEERL